MEVYRMGGLPKRLLCRLHDGRRPRAWRWKRVMIGDGVGFDNLNENTKAGRLAFDANSKDREAVKLIAGHKIG